MNKVFIAGSNIISSLGFTSKENFNNVLKGNSGLRYHSEGEIHPISYINRSFFKEHCLKNKVEAKVSLFEKLCILSIKDAVSKTIVDLKEENCLLIIATTKGNVGFLEKANERTQDIHLWESAKKIGDYFGAVNRPMLISNACVSSILAQVTAVRLLKAEKYKHVIVCGADLISEFVLSGFTSFKALSNNSCRPFDKNRDGLSLGEGAGTLVLTTDSTQAIFNGASCVAGASSNDANHISGPSRTGDGLANAITSTLNQAQIKPEFISAHGTATMYNDEMESKAINLAQLNDVPVNSLKGFFGHTLGAAGIIETIITLCAMNESKALETKGFVDYGVSEQINLVTRTEDLNFNSFLKIASGFGGCNAAILYSKY
ncbi:beta-ketoacyl-[acyl-carrier-protein] synthase family protein [Labilibaculum antarcticum]|uniref:3-oxoacyl-[acyl-carrier-protein] synthase-1 n=1 Tax=Labilibaculum antarcticum TaxID=1717717 RepID=A0A1Y1CPR9_9BACT|nr:beta-ketoacyl synthase N-terminal-like domain-containing protein [Labilibaculum antarcticum]BAX82459.1 3-oxoacyl-[acyl-carrier-protein] synthase-1 [Labilibaculum antarcticum]